MTNYLRTIQLFGKGSFIPLKGSWRLELYTWRVVTLREMHPFGRMHFLKLHQFPYLLLMLDELLGIQVSCATYMLVILHSYCDALMPTSFHVASCSYFALSCSACDYVHRLANIKLHCTTCCHTMSWKYYQT